MNDKQAQIAHGRELRKKVNRKEQASFKLHSSRPPIAEMIGSSNFDRLPDLIPIRHQRMSVSPFSFYRGTAAIMARDLHRLPHTGLSVQSIGDCHLMNFGGFATPERTLVFDANDFDETHPAPWEWDLKRLATSFVLAARHINMSEATAQEMAFTVAQSYSTNMDLFTQMTMLDLWYMKFDITTLRNEAKSSQIRQRLDDVIVKAHKKTSQQVFYKITQQVLGEFEITDQPPLVYHPFELDKVKDMMANAWNGYLKTLQHDRRFLVNHYKVVDVALKVVGVGSVGTRCYIALLMNKNNEPLFLQVKEARSSVLEPFTAKSTYAHHGQRVVEGQRLVQAASDIFLGWSTGPMGRHFYFRQLKDKKISPEIETFNTEMLTAYARLCGRMLARAHAKTGAGDIIKNYIGKSDRFAEAVTLFATAYAKQTYIDYDHFIKAIRLGKLAIIEEV